MKSFDFPLQKILELREFEMDKAQIELGKANAEVQRIQNLLNAVAAQKVTMSNMLDNGSATDIMIYARSQEYLQFLEQQKEKYLQEMVQAQMVLDEKRAIFQEAMKKKKVLEKLKESKYKAWKKEALRQEEIIVDDIISAKSIKK